MNSIFNGHKAGPNYGAVLATVALSPVCLGVGKMLLPQVYGTASYLSSMGFGCCAKVVSIAITPALQKRFGTHKIVLVFADPIGGLTTYGLYCIAFRVGLIVNPITAPVAVTLTVVSIAVGYFIPPYKMKGLKITTDNIPPPDHLGPKTEQVKRFLSDFDVLKSDQEKIDLLERAVLEMDENQLEELRLALAHRKLNGVDLKIFTSSVVDFPEGIDDKQVYNDEKTIKKYKTNT